MYDSPDLYNVLFHKNLYLLENYVFYRSKKYFLAIKIQCVKTLKLQCQQN